ncbi:hypothetical protein LINPERHAP1_LOCUS32799, partial [Linum perenne]
LPPLLKALSEATEETGIASISFAISDMTGYLYAPTTFHQVSISNSSVTSPAPSRASSRYLSNSALFPITLCCKSYPAKVSS